MKSNDPGRKIRHGSKSPDHSSTTDDQSRSPATRGKRRRRRMPTDNTEESEMPNLVHRNQRKEKSEHSDSPEFCNREKRGRTNSSSDSMSLLERKSEHDQEAIITQVRRSQASLPAQETAAHAMPQLSMGFDQSQNTVEAFRRLVQLHSAAAAATFSPLQQQLLQQLPVHHPGLGPLNPYPLGAAQLQQFPYQLQGAAPRNVAMLENSMGLPNFLPGHPLSFTNVPQISFGTPAAALFDPSIFMQPNAAAFAQLQMQQATGLSNSSVHSLQSASTIGAIRDRDEQISDPRHLARLGRQRSAEADAAPSSKTDAPPSSNSSSSMPARRRKKSRRTIKEASSSPPNGDNGVILFIQEDQGKLNDHQIFLRHQIEYFRASQDDILSHTRGKNRPIVLQQVGIRCRHCSHMPVGRRQKGSTYFPSNLMGIYQAAQNLSVEHLQSGLCPEIPQDIRNRFASFSSSKPAASGAGKKYWAEAGNMIGLIDTDDGIRFAVDLQQPPLSPASNSG